MTRNFSVADIPVRNMIIGKNITSTKTSHQFQFTTTALVANRWTSHIIIISSAFSSITQQSDERRLRPILLAYFSQPSSLSRSSLRAASRGDYVVPRTNRRFADRAFSIAWYQLPTYLKMTQLTSAFCRGLKTFPSRLHLWIMRVVLTL